MTWDTVIGLEVHAQLNTRSKLFSGSSTAFGSLPNSQTAYIDAGLPGVLPVLNQSAVLMAVQFGLAIGAEINNFSFFERKNYFYPDLPKGYQISQFQRPIVSNGHLDISINADTCKTIEIVRAHLEEDAGKSLHDAHPDFTGIDLNRAGTPLLEIVTSPCLRCVSEVLLYLKVLHQLVRFLGICDGNMQEGSFRCDVNLSLKPAGATTLGTRVELKNLNSFRFIEKAIVYEQRRQQDLLERGLPVNQETRLYNPDTDATESLRSKEKEYDYRYFPDPDLLPIEITANFLKNARESMPLLPSQIKQALEDDSKLPAEDTHFLLSSPAVWRYFYDVRQQTQMDDKTIINWLKGSLSAAINDSGTSFENPPMSPAMLADLLNYIHKKIISHTIARQVFNKLLVSGGSLADIIEKEGHARVNNNKALDMIIQKMVAQYPEQANDYRAGKEKLLAFFTGQVMKQMRGQVDPGQVNQLLKKYLSQD